MTIKHLVLSGGSWKGLFMVGIIKKLIEENYLVLSEIETFWATSVGTILAVFLCLKIDFLKLIDFFINVPFNKNKNINFNTFLEIYQNSGFMDKNFILSFLKSPFNSIDLNIETITLKEFYDYSEKEINFFCINYNTVETTCFNYKSHPDVKILDVLYCSCSLPIIFKPNKINDVIYLDGGLNVHYPSKYCLEKYENKEIFGIGIRTNNTEENEFNNLLEFITKLLDKILFLKQRNNFKMLENQIVVEMKSTNLSKSFSILSDYTERKNVINDGYKLAEDYLKKLNNSI